MIIFTDLDNCLLDSSYSAISIRDFTHNLIEKGIVISVISSKTSPEIDCFFNEMEFFGPYAAENGGLVVIDEEKKELATRSEIIKRDLRNTAKEMNTEIELFSEMKNERIKELTGLPDHLIPPAKKRSFSEPFRFVSGPDENFLEKIKSLGYTIFWGGNFYQVYRGSSKGRAVQIIKKKKNGFSIGVGDSVNDYSMLDKCDYPILLGSKKNKKYRSFEGFGPIVWKKAVEEALEEKNV
jgi:mannosyl-3-phosphoglycerate phosphatase family protein